MFPSINIKLKKAVILLSALFFVISTSCGFYIFKIKNQVQELFRLNQSLQNDGYYMAEFEFKMMGIVYYLDKGKCVKALSTISKFHSQLKHKKNLTKIPQFENAEEEMNFYLNFQNPRTGAFMDDSYPYCTFNEPTENVISHLDALAKKSGSPLKLKYPLKYLDKINSPESLYDFLNDVSHVGRLGTKFPETTFFFARSLLSSFNDEGVIAKNNLYAFSGEFKNALIEWFYKHQDRETGYWGPLSKHDGQLVKPDLNNTASIIKTFVDRDGSDLIGSHPLKHRHRIFKTTLDLLKRPLPEENALDEWHDWNLSVTKGIKMLLRYLWKDASIEDKLEARGLLESYVKTKFQYFYVPEEGGFSFYPNSRHASLDGTSGFIFKDIGAYSYEMQKKLWGDSKKGIRELKAYQASTLERRGLDRIAGQPGVNSLRVYQSAPDYTNLTQSVLGVIYPKQTSVLDIMEMVPRITEWLNDETASIGNWSSKERMKEFYLSLNIQKPLIFKNTGQLDAMDAVFQNQGELTVIAFDILQIPIYKITYKKR